MVATAATHGRLRVELSHVDRLPRHPHAGIPPNAQVPSPCNGLPAHRQLNFNSPRKGRDIASLEHTALPTASHNPCCAASIAADHRRADHQRLGNHRTPTIIRAWKYETIRLSHLALYDSHRDTTQPSYAPTKRRPSPTPQTLFKWAPANNGQFDIALPQASKRFDQQIKSL